MTHLERDPLDDVQRVDDVAQRLAHLAAVLVSDHRVKVHLGNRGPWHSNQVYYFGVTRLSNALLLFNW